MLGRLVGWVEGRAAAGGKQKGAAVAAVFVVETKPQ